MVVSVAKALRGAGPLAGALALSLGVSACSSSSNESARDETGASEKRPGFGDGPVIDRSVVALTDSLEACDVEHRGVVVDFGTEMTLGRVRTLSPMRAREHDGATWAEVSDREVAISVTLTEPRAIFVSARVSALAAKSMGVYIDGLPLHTARFRDKSANIVQTDVTKLPLDAGEHTVLLKFSPKNREPNPYADIDWVRVGFEDDIKATFGAPTQNELVLESAALGKVPHHALQLRSPTTVRCPVKIPKQGRFRVALGMKGPGEAEFVLRARVDGSPPIEIRRQKIGPDEANRWLDVDADLSAFSGQWVHLELSAEGAPAASRVLIGDPEILVSTVAPSKTPKAQVVVLLIENGVARGELLPGSPMPAFSAFAGEATQFHRHRGSAFTTRGNFASMLTGVPARIHGDVELALALPPVASTILHRSQDASVQTGFFTSVPLSFKPFGFSRGLQKVVEVSPVEGERRSPIAEASAWLSESLERAPNGRIFAVIHASGGHPPWSLPPKDMETLPPLNYTGDIQPRRSGQQLRAIRNRRAGRGAIQPPDQARLSALHRLSLAEDDRAFGELRTMLEHRGVADRSLILVTSDAAQAPNTLYAEEAPFEEGSLELPLLVSFPGGQAGGREVDVLSSPEDLPETIAIALELAERADERSSPREPKFGRDLMNLASLVALGGEAPHVAVFHDGYSVRMDDHLLRVQNKTSYCDLARDFACVFDGRSTHPLVTSAMLRFLADLEDKTVPWVPEAATLDDRTLAALRVWGAMD